MVRAGTVPTEHVSGSGRTHFPKQLQQEQQEQETWTKGQSLTLFAPGSMADGHWDAYHFLPLNEMSTAAAALNMPSREGIVKLDR